MGQHLTKCDVCVTSSKYLNESITFGVASNMTAVYMTCKKNEDKFTKKIMCLNKTTWGGGEAWTKKGSPKKTSATDLLHKEKIVRSRKLNHMYLLPTLLLAHFYQTK